MPYTYAEVKSLESYFEFAKSGRRALSDDVYRDMVSDFVTVLSLFPVADDLPFAPAMEGSELAIYNLWYFYLKWHGHDPFTLKPPVANFLCRVSFGLPTGYTLGKGDSELMQNLLRFFIPGSPMPGLPITKVPEHFEHLKALFELVASHSKLGAFALIEDLSRISPGVLKSLKQRLDRGELKLEAGRDTLIFLTHLCEQPFKSQGHDHGCGMALLELISHLHDLRTEDCVLSAKIGQISYLCDFVRAFVDVFQGADLETRLSELLTVVNESYIDTPHRWHELAVDIAMPYMLKKGTSDALSEAKLSTDRLNDADLSVFTAPYLRDFVKCFPGEEGVFFSQHFSGVLHLVLAAYQLVDHERWRSGIRSVLRSGDVIAYSVILAINLEAQCGHFDIANWSYGGTSQWRKMLMNPSLLTEVQERVRRSASPPSVTEADLPVVSTNAICLLVAYQLAGVHAWWRAVAENESKLDKVDQALTRLLIDSKGDIEMIKASPDAIVASIDAKPAYLLWGFPVRAHLDEASPKGHDSALAHEESFGVG